MKRQIISALFTLAVASGVYAGDAAAFVDGGFSADGSVYVFGQYGRTDKSFQGWAELYAVDVAKNDYVKGKVFITKPSQATKNKRGKDLYAELSGKSYFEYQKYDLKNAAPDKILYIRESEQKNGTDEISFKDFVSSVSQDQAYYHVKLVPSVSGKGLNVKSSFYIMLTKVDLNGKVLATQKIGTPSLTRKGVKNYKIERIVSSADGKNIVFIIEKTCEDSTGTNIRYMLETASLNKEFFTNLAEKETVLPASSETETPAVSEPEYEPVVLYGSDFGDAK